jgi:hypothetical protein
LRHVCLATTSIHGLDFLTAKSCRDHRIYSQALFVAVRVSIDRELEDPQQITIDTEDCPILRIIQYVVQLHSLVSLGSNRSFIFETGGNCQHRGIGLVNIGVYIEYLQKYLGISSSFKQTRVWV